VRGWDSGTAKQLWEFTPEKPEQTIEAVAFAPDGKTLAAGARDGKVKLLDPATGKQTAALHDGTGAVTFLDWSADGKRLAATQQGAKRMNRVVVWNVATGKVAGVSGPFDQYRSHVALAPQATHLAAITPESRLAIWTVPGEKPLATVKVTNWCGLAWSAD